MVLIDQSLLPGTWSCELIGVNFFSLKKRKEWKLILGPDDTTLQYYKIDGSMKMLQDGDLLRDHPDLWGYTPPANLSIKRAIRPMPEHELPEWSYEESLYDIIYLDSTCLVLNDRPYGGECIYVMRRELPDPW